MLITQKKLNLKCLFHGRVMRVYKLLFYPSKKSVNFCYNKVSFIFFQKENYFSKQCAIDRRSDNPTVHDFGYNDNTVKNQFSIIAIGGNVKGPAEKFNEICNKPLPK